MICLLLVLLLLLVLGQDAAVSAGKYAILLLARDGGALEAELTAERLLDVVGHLDGGLAPGAGELPGQLVEERDLVRRARVHEEEVGVHELEAANGGAVEHALLGVDRDGHDAVRELGEERAEAQQERLAACGALGADDQVTLLQQPADVLGVLVALPRQRDGLDGRDELRELGDAVGDAADLAAERDGDLDGVEHGAVIADEEDARVALLGRRRRGALDDQPDAHELVGVEDDALGEGQVDVHAHERQREAERHPKEGDERDERRRALNEAAVVQDQRTQQLVLRHRAVLPRRDKVRFLHSQPCMSVCIVSEMSMSIISRCGYQNKTRTTTQ
jgi:hypothetical protein